MVQEGSEGFKKEQNVKIIKKKDLLIDSISLDLSFPALPKSLFSLNILCALQGNSLEIIQPSVCFNRTLNINSIIKNNSDPFP